MTDESRPATQKVRAIDVVPYDWGLWCAVGDGKPFVNEICHVAWSEDGESLWFGLDTHNAYKSAPNDELDLVPMPETPYRTAERRAEAAAKHARNIKGARFLCPCCGQWHGKVEKRGPFDE